MYTAKTSVEVNHMNEWKENVYSALKSLRMYA